MYLHAKLRHDCGQHAGSRPDLEHHVVRTQERLDGLDLKALVQAANSLPRQ